MWVGSPCRMPVALLLGFLLTQASGGDGDSSTKTPTGSVKRVQVKGWTGVNEHWPVSEPDYFIATEKGHHFIQVKLPTKELQSDLKVELRYYYAYSRVRPFVQIVPCSSNVDIITDKPSNSTSAEVPAPKIWNKHEMLIKRADCKKRKELTYNILLHDANDVFAWSFLKINSADSEPLTTSTTTTTSTTKAPATPPVNEPSDGDSLTVDEIYAAITTARPKTTPTSTSPKPAPITPKTTATAPEPTQTTTKLTDSEPTAATPAPTSTTQESATLSPEPTSTVTQPATPEFTTTTTTTTPTTTTETTTTKRTTDEQTDRPETPETSTREAPPATTEKLADDSSTPATPEEETEVPIKWPTDAITESNAERQPEAEKSPKPDEEPENGSEGRRSLARRRKRNVEWPQENDAGRPLARQVRATPERLSLICKPSLCDQSLVIHPRFIKVIGAAAVYNKLPSAASGPVRPLMFLNTKNEPLTFDIESDDHDFADKNLCFDFYLFMDADTKLSLKLDAQNGGDELLEVIERKSSDTAASRWEQTKRCISDYMPRLRAARPAAAVTEKKQGQEEAVGAKGKQGQQELEIHKVKMSLEPQSPSPDRKKILVALVRDKMVSVHEAPGVLSYLPNVVAFDGFSTDQVRKMWTLDQDGVQKARFRMATRRETTGAGAESRQPAKVLQVDLIDPKQDHFDLTTRWIKIDDPEMLDSPVLFNYRADKADWIDALDFEFQNADHAANQWRSERIYTRPKALVFTTTEKPQTQAHYEQKTDGSTLETSGVKRVEPAKDNANGGSIEAPIRLKGLNTKEFRIRLRHHLAKDLPELPMSHQLTITKLAFGDACALDRPYCLNGGKCRPTSVSKANCSCPRGYSGEHCEIFRPCEVVYAGNLTGSQFCQKVGARCVENIPVFRCHWPDDKYYQCKVLALPFSPGPPEGAGGSAGEPGGGNGGASEPPSDADKLAQLEANANKQQQLIIVMGVFMAALMLFAIVIVINMITKLRKSNRRLKTAQIEVHELTRQTTPGTSSSAFSSSAPPPFGRPMMSRQKPAAVVAYSNRAFDAAGH